MAWKRLWALICTVIFLTLVQKSACFRIRYDPVPDDGSGKNNSPISTIDVPKITPRTLESDGIKFEDSNVGSEKKTESNSIIQPDKSGPKINPENGDNTENNYSVKQSVADVLKGFGRNPEIRRLVENEDPQLFEKFVNYGKTSQPDIAEIGSVSLQPESVESLKNENKFESDNSNSDNQIMNFETDKSQSDDQIMKLTLPESPKPVRPNFETNEKLTEASITVASKQLREQKEESLINAADAMLAPLDEASKYLNAASLTQMTLSTGKGEAQSIECDLPHLDIYSRCFANILEVTVTSRSELFGRISFQEAEGHVDMSGYNVSFYAVYGIKSTSGFMWHFQKGVTVEDVDVGCKTCHILDLRMMVLIMEDNKDKNKRCVIDLTCTQPNMPDQPTLGSSQGSQNYVPQDTIISESDTSRVHSAKTTLNILKGTSMESEVLPQDHFAVGLGTQLGLIISAYTKDITLDLHILNCEARGEDGKGITLIKDGCSAHHVVKEFQEVLGVVHDPEIDDHHVVRVTQHTTFQVFNFSPKPQTIAIICKIKMCGGECDEHPGCVNSEVNLGHRKQRTYSVFYEEVVLGQMLNVAGLPEFRGAPKNLDILSNIIEPEEEAVFAVKEGEEQTLDLHANCVPRSVFYISLGVLGGLFIFLLVLALYFSKAIVLPRIASSYKINMDEVESPSRSLYQEYSSPRRRSPGSKTPDQSILNRIVYS